MKRAFCAFLVILICLALSSCGKDTAQEMPETSENRTPIADKADELAQSVIQVEILPMDLNSYDINTDMTEAEKLELVSSFGENEPVSAVVYMNGSLSKGDFFEVSAESDPETLKAIQDIAFSGDVTYESLGALEGIGYYSYAYYITYRFSDGSEHTFFYNLYEENNMIGYDGCWFYPDKPIDTYVFSAVYEAYKRYGDEGEVQNYYELTNQHLLGGPTRIFTPMQIDSSIPYTDMTAEEKKSYLESFDTEEVDSAFVFMHGGTTTGAHYELFRDGDGDILQTLIDYAFDSGEFTPIREHHDGYNYEYYIIFRTTDGEEITLFFHHNGDSVQFDGQSFRVHGMCVGSYTDAPVYDALKYCRDNGSVQYAYKEQ